MSSVDNLINIGTIIVVILLAVICVLVFVYLYLKRKEQMPQNKNTENLEESTTSKKEYNIKSIFNFMDFEKIEDNMIIQKKGKYLMVLECQGVNYDLMSEMERTSVEQGFIEFLNTLRNEIQIHVQTRTVNLEDSISSYKMKFREIEDKYIVMESKYNEMKKSNAYSDKEIQKAYLELVRQRNKYEYTKDIIADTERSSLNSNVLHKKYYIIIPYYEDEIITENYSKDEIQSMIFSELYTRAKSIIRTLSRCEVNAKILNSEELIDLLYIAYNRDDADIFGSRKIMNAGFEEMYSTAPDVLDKKMKLLDKEIEEKATKIANEAVTEARSDKEMMLRLREQNKENLIFDFAEDLIKENSTIIGEDISEDAKVKVRRKRSETQKGGTKNVAKEEK